MRRKLFTLVAVGLALLGMTVALFWLRSYSAYDFLMLPLPGKAVCQFASEKGVVEIQLVWNWDGPRPLAWSTATDFRAWVHAEYPSLTTVPTNFGSSWEWESLDIKYRDGVAATHWYPKNAAEVYKPSVPFRVAFIPHWIILLVAAVFPFLRFGFGLRRYTLLRYRKIRGLCLKCGYDLSGTPDRCPECGSTPGKNTAVPT